MPSTKRMLMQLIGMLLILWVILSMNAAVAYSQKPTGSEPDTTSYTPLTRIEEEKYLDLIDIQAGMIRKLELQTAWRDSSWADDYMRLERIMERRLQDKTWQVKVAYLTAAVVAVIATTMLWVGSRIRP